MLSSNQGKLGLESRWVDLCFWSCRLMIQLQPNKDWLKHSAPKTFFVNMGATC